KGWLQQNKQLISIGNMEGWISPKLGCRFETTGGSLEVYRPDGQRMETYVETSKRAEQESQRAQQEAQRAEQESQRAEQEAQRAEQEAQARRDAIPRLLGLGLSVEQVAAALGLSVEEVNQNF
ncbi:MAG: Uma2 family endonuclease, partial [Symploca sp. SIO2D2]|nr:Uma2 family endonuclease [Symploca sp. SIO2D2]